MMSIRKLVCKPKLDDWTPLAKFYYADETLTAVASELDCFDSRKDPEKCQRLVNQLRYSQDRVIQIIDEILNDVFPNENQRASRDYRVKFPDDILHDNLPGQLWFGAECLSAGSNIIDRESESDFIRPLAKKLTCHLDNLREILKEQSLRNPNFYSEKVKNSLKIYDELFAEFEYNYVSAMVHVKSAKEYDLQQEVVIMFSEALIRAIEKGYITRDIIEICDPSIMITLPRLAIVCGLLIYPDGPLNVDRKPENVAEMFQPFKTLLQKIRDLLFTLTDAELHTLERALSSQEPVPFDQSKVTLISEYRNRAGAMKKSQKLLKQKSNSVDDIFRLNNGRTVSSEEESSLGSSPQQALVDNDCNFLESNKVEQEVEVLNGNNEEEQTFDDGEQVDNGEQQSRPTLISSALIVSGKSTESEDMTLNIWKSTRNKILRSRFRSPEDLIHRLFVCVAGVADQWQSNYPSDLRAILKIVFQTSADETETPGEKVLALPSSRADDVNGVDEGGVNTSIVVPWVPDAECNNCTGCQRSFTFVVRRHHCRNCGKIFCSRCSANSLSLPKLGYVKAVRVCNHCYFYKLPTFTDESE